MLPLPALLVLLQINERNIMWNDELKLRLIKVGPTAAAAAAASSKQQSGTAPASCPGLGSA
jgi:hypothetical protein